MLKATNPCRISVESRGEKAAGSHAMNAGKEWAMVAAEEVGDEAIEAARVLGPKSLRRKRGPDGPGKGLGKDFGMFGFAKGSSGKGEDFRFVIPSSFLG